MKKSLVMSRDFFVGYGMMRVDGIAGVILRLGNIQLKLGAEIHVTD